MSSLPLGPTEAHKLTNARCFRWVEEFVKHGGYTGLLERLKELLDIEWRCDLPLFIYLLALLP